MTREDILRLRDTAEQTKVQFKERVTRDNKYDVCCEMVAQSNYRGGMIVVGIDDKTGRINPLSFREAQETTNLLGSLASEGVVPQILLDIENVQMDGGVIVVATIKQGKNKPYRDNKGIVWVKQGADKRKVFDNAELIAMLMENGQMHPDCMPIKGTSIKDLDENTVRDYLLSRFRNDYERQQLPIGELKLKVNREKTECAYVGKLKFLGYGFYVSSGKCRLRLHEKSEAKLRRKLRQGCYYSASALPKG